MRPQCKPYIINTKVLHGIMTFDKTIPKLQESTISQINLYFTNNSINFSLQVKMRSKDETNN